MQGYLETSNVASGEKYDMTMNFTDISNDGWVAIGIASVTTTEPKWFVVSEFALVSKTQAKVTLKNTLGGTLRCGVWINLLYGRLATPDSDS